MERREGFVTECGFGKADLVAIFEGGHEVCRYPQEDGSFEIYYYDVKSGAQWTMRGFDDDRDSRSLLESLAYQGLKGLQDTRMLESIADLYGGSFSGWY